MKSKILFLLFILFLSNYCAAQCPELEYEIAKPSLIDSLIMLSLEDGELIMIGGYIKGFRIAKITDCCNRTIESQIDNQSTLSDGPSFRQTLFLSRLCKYLEVGLDECSYDIMIPQNTYMVHISRQSSILQMKFFIEK
ncbi:MAG: hypothetical protein AAFY36_14835 [Bacteroidota bacterium]